MPVSPRPRAQVQPLEHSLNIVNNIRTVSSMVGPAGYDGITLVIPELSGLRQED